MDARVHAAACPQIGGRPIAAVHGDARNPAGEKAAAVMREDRRKESSVEETRQPRDSFEVARRAEATRLQHLAVRERHAKGAALTVHGGNGRDLAYLHHRNTDGVDERPQVEAELGLECLRSCRCRLQAAIRNSAGA